MVSGGIDPIALDQRQKDSICVTYSDMKRECRIVVLDREGHERARISRPSRFRRRSSLLSVTS